MSLAVAPCLAAPDLGSLGAPGGRTTAWRRAAAPQSRRRPAARRGPSCRCCLVLACLVGLVAGCARVAPPSGGPVDTTPPVILSQTPAPDATAVPVDAPVTLEFSEDMDRDRVAGAVFVAPETPWQARWQGRRLQLHMQLQPDRTYVVTVGSGARDLRGNPLARSHTLAFATGAALNRGVLAGTVYRRHLPAGGVDVWAYDLAAFHGQAGTDPPAYRTQTGQDGSYTLTRLAAGQYRVLAVVDRNRNGRCDAGEGLALPAGDTSVSEADTARAGDLLLALPPGAAPRLVRVQAPDSQRILLQFSETVAATETELAIDGLTIESVYASPQDSTRIYVRTTPQQSGRRYAITRLVVRGQPLKWDEPLRGSNRADATAPRLVGAASRVETVAPGDTLWLQFSEAMAPQVPGDFWATGDSLVELRGTWVWPEPTRVGWVGTWPAPGRHLAVGRLAGLRDLSGLAVADSALRVQLEVLDSTALGTITGQIRGGHRGAAEVCAQGRPRRFCVAVTDSAFSLRRLPPGDYVLYAYVDANGNGQQDRGSLDPWTPAEAYGRRPAQVALPRGENLAGVDLWCR